MRQGRPADLPQVLELWRDEVRAGKRDCVPGDAHLRQILAGFDWEARSRMVEGEDHRLGGAVLVSNRSTPHGTVAGIDASVIEGRQELLHDLLRWGLALAHAAGAVAAQVWRGHDGTEALDGLGLELIRPWWRMDRTLAIEPSVPAPVAGYELRDATAVPPGKWATVHNLAFADHWRFSPRTEDELMTERPPGLSLMAFAADGSPAALTVCQIEAYTADRRPQPVGIISSVGTLPDHRRRGLATWLVTEALLRLHRAGARHASLYVDAMNPMRAHDVYRKQGFELAFETEVWEATFR